MVQRYPLPLLATPPPALSDGRVWGGCGGVAARSAAPSQERGSIVAPADAAHARVARAQRGAVGEPGALCLSAPHNVGTPAGQGEPRRLTGRIIVRRVLQPLSQAGYLLCY